MEPFGTSTSREFENKSPEIILINPQAGSGKAIRSAKLCQSRLPQPSQIVISTSPLATEQLAARAAADHVPRLIICGGDGTIHHALNGYLSIQNSPTRLAIAPSGTANDYAATLRTFTREKTRSLISVDVGSISYPNFHRYFFNVAGIGLTAHTALSSRPSPWFPARLRYTFGLMRTLCYGWQHVRTRIQIPNLEPLEKDLLTLSVAIGQREGSFVLAPDARVDDGIFNVLLATNLRRRDVCRYLPGLMIGKLPTTDPRIQFHTTEQLTLRTQSPLHFHLDGEIYGEGTLPAEVDVQIATSQQLPIELLVL